MLPAYKVEKYILRALKSLSNQTFKRFEIVFVDDCGGDNSIALIQDYFKNDNRVHIYHNPKNMGTYHARRVGTENARGEYIVFLDPDDELVLSYYELEEYILQEGYEVLEEIFGWLYIIEIPGLFSEEDAQSRKLLDLSDTRIN